MSINAVITDVTKRPNGDVALHLEPYEKGELAGQSTLVVVNPPEPWDLLRSAIGTHIWGGSGSIMIGETKWAERLSYTRIELRTAGAA